MTDSEQCIHQERTWGGIGPKLALITLPYVILSIAVAQRDPEFLALSFFNAAAAQLAGLLLLAVGVVFWLWSAIVFLAEFKKGHLITRGPYGLCRNPIYASFMVFVLPALSLIFRSGIILSIDLALYINFKMAIHGERLLLQQSFGEAYDAYSKRVNELFPFPRFR